MSIAIKVENLSKAYQLGEIGTGTISRDIERWVAKVRGKEDPFLKIGEANDRSIKGTSDVVWSLKDINFEIEQGDAVGIIGRNGAGKSTLLKILSKVTSPTAGKISGRGRIASLLEVGTGFHPELTGRENIYLNGAMLGMRKKEITRKLDQIIDFSGVERYIDTPVKRYSSGMYVRLAFAVAAHLESEILIVDEVLAVGDAEFQKKCLGKMNDVSKHEGRTVLFVSHNIQAIRTLTESCIYLKNGQLKSFGPSSEIISEYFDESISLVATTKETSYYRRKERDALADITSVIINNYEKDFPAIPIGEPIHFKFSIDVKEDIRMVLLNIIVKNTDGETVTLIASYDDGYLRDLEKGGQEINFTILKNSFSPGKYFGVIAISPENGGLSYDILTDYPLFEIYNDGRIVYWPDREFGGFIVNNISWS